ncbi:MAG: hypothetical protein B7Z26_11245, partial [Asticcacaulis sp. 32-58-5]
MRDISLLTLICPQGLLRDRGFHRDGYGLNVGISAFEIDLFGRQRNLSRAAFEEWLASEEGRKSAQIAIVSETATAWLTYAATADALSVARETLASQQQSLKVNQRRESLGIGTGLDVAQAQTQVDSALAAVADYTTDLAQAKNALDLLVGAPVTADLLPPTLGAGDPDETMSAAAWRTEQKGRLLGRLFRPLIDRLFA